VQHFTVRGRSYYYFRRGNAPRIRLYGKPGSEQFRREYAAARGVETPLLPLPRQPAKARTVLGRQAARAPKIGVYLLFLEGALVYVGASLNMPERVKSHRSNGRPFDRAYFIQTLQKERFVVESVLIAALSPRQNRRGNNENATGTQNFKPANRFENSPLHFLDEQPVSR
jgi:hypothetical protein